MAAYFGKETPKLGFGLGTVPTLTSACLDFITVR